MSAPKIPKLIKSDLDGIIKTLIEKGVCDDQNFPVVKRTGDLWEVTFSGAEHISISYSDIEYEAIYQELSNKRSYTVKLIDGGLLQIMYRFKDNVLIQHRLAFYPSPTLRTFQDDPESYIISELYLDIVQRRIVPFPLRFDFDDRKDAHIDIEHPKSHLTLGDAKNCRIPVSAPLTPRWFIDFILRNFYKTREYEFVSCLPSHKHHFTQCITPDESGVAHMVFPNL